MRGWWGGRAPNQEAIPWGAISETWYQLPTGAVGLWARETFRRVRRFPVPGQPLFALARERVPAPRSPGQSHATRRFCRIAIYLRDNSLQNHFEKSRMPRAFRGLRDPRRHRVHVDRWLCSWDARQGQRHAWAWRIVTGDACNLPTGLRPVAMASHDRRASILRNSECRLSDSSTRRSCCCAHR